MNTETFPVLLLQRLGLVTMKTCTCGDHSKVKCNVAQKITYVSNYIFRSYDERVNV